MDSDAFESDAPVQIERMLMKPTDMDSAVVTRTTTKFRPQGGATYGENARTIQFRMSSSDYASLDTLKFGFKCTKPSQNMIPEDMYALTCIGDIRVECGASAISSACHSPASFCVKQAGLSRKPLTAATGMMTSPSFRARTLTGFFTTSALQFQFYLAPVHVAIVWYLAHHFTSC